MSKVFSFYLAPSSGEIKDTLVHSDGSFITHKRYLFKGDSWYFRIVSCVILDVYATRLVCKL